LQTANAIAELFPTLSAGVFFVRPSSGRLYLKWQRLRDGLTKAGLIKRRSYIKKGNQAAEAEVADDDEANHSDAINDYEEDAGESALILLKTVVSPWSDVIRQWSASYDQRRLFLDDSNESTDNYLSPTKMVSNF
jgi:hypothetical protein